MKIHNRGKFISIAFVAAKLKTFSFSYRFSIHEMALFGFFLEPYSPKYKDFVEIFTWCSIQTDKKYVLKIFEKFDFLQKTDVPKVCTFGPTLTPRFPLKMAGIEKSKYLWEKTLAIGLYKYVKIKAPSALPFPRNIRLPFALFRRKKRLGHMFKGRSQNLSCPIVVLQFLSIF